MEWNRKKNENEWDWRFGILEIHYKSREAIFGDLFSASKIFQLSSTKVHCPADSTLLVLVNFILFFLFLNIEGSSYVRYYHRMLLDFEYFILFLWFNLKKATCDDKEVKLNIPYADWTLWTLRVIYSNRCLLNSWQILFTMLANRDLHLLTDVGRRQWNLTLLNSKWMDIRVFPKKFKLQFYSISVESTFYTSFMVQTIVNWKRPHAHKA